MRWKHLNMRIHHQGASMQQQAYWWHSTLPAIWNVIAVHSSAHNIQIHVRRYLTNIRRIAAPLLTAPSRFCCIPPRVHHTAAHPFVHRIPLQTYIYLLHPLNTECQCALIVFFYICLHFEVQRASARLNVFSSHCCSFASAFYSVDISTLNGNSYTNTQTTGRPTVLRTASAHETAIVCTVKGV